MAESEIHRLKQCAQLGIVPQAWETARHTRWDYISLILHLTRLVERDTRLSLSSTVKLDDGTVVSSGQELVQSWAILLQTGHLAWGFTAERILLQELSRLGGTRGSNHRRNLILSVPEGDARTRAEFALERGHYYSFHQILAFYRAKKVFRDEEMRREARRLLASYFARTESESSSLRRCKELFRRIRRLAFLYLDAEHSPTALSLRISRLLTTPEDLSRIVSSNTVESQDEMMGLERFLARRIYLGPEVLEATAQFYFPIRDRVRSNFRRPSLAEAIEDLAKSDFSPAKALRDERLSKVARIEIETRFFNLPSTTSAVLDASKNVEEAASFSRSMGKDVFICYETDVRNDILVVQAHARSDSAVMKASALSYLVSYVTRLEETDNLESLGIDLRIYDQQRYLGVLGEQLILAALDVFFLHNYRWEWTRQVEGLRCVSGRAGLVGTVLDQIVSESRMSRADKYEVVATLAAARSRRSTMPMVASVSGVRAVDRDGKHSLEIDGVVLSVDRPSGRLVLTLTEAKSSGRGGATGEAAKDLSEKVRHLVRSPGVTMSRTCRSGPRGTVWRNLRLPILGSARGGWRGHPHRGRFLENLRRSSRILSSSGGGAGGV